MNNIITSREKILEISKIIVVNEGADSLNIRNVAKLCNISVGSIYNYFPSKSNLLSATIENIWEDIFKTFNETVSFKNFVDCISLLYIVIKKGDIKYNNFFYSHSLNFNLDEKEKGKASMQNYIIKLQNKLLKALDEDKDVNLKVFSEDLKKEEFISYIFNLLILNIKDGKNDCNGILHLIKICIY